jgi:hypothetical protein
MGKGHKAGPEGPTMNSRWGGCRGFGDGVGRAQGREKPHGITIYSLLTVSYILIYILGRLGIPL